MKVVLRPYLIALVLTLPLSLHAQQATSTNCSTAACVTEPVPTDGEPAVAVVNHFLGRHKDFVPCQQNANAMAAYLDAHHLDPLAESSFERAFEDLRHRGQLKISPR